MMKVFLLVGFICIPTFECIKFQPEKNIQYLDKQSCMKDGKKMGDKMFKRMNEKKIPTNIYVYCQETEQHREYS